MKWNFKTVKKPDWFIETEGSKKVKYVTFWEMTFYICFSHFLKGIM